VHWILVLALVGAASSRFSLMWPNLAAAKFLARFRPDFQIRPNLSTAAVHNDYLPLKVMKLVLACHLTVRRTLSGSRLK